MRISIVLLALCFIAIANTAQSKQCQIPNPRNCDIKGNINAENVRLYHTPQHASYASVRMSKCGEQWFCSATEAEKAGWEPAGDYKPGLPVHDSKDHIPSPDAKPLHCAIKGNIATDRHNRGIKRYHDVGTPRYAETVVRLEQGDRWFCSIQQAQKSGFERAGTFVGKNALDYRDCEIPTDIPAQALAQRCFIKGNISRSGRIFHVRGSRWYAETQVTLQRGEKWFCEEDDAIKAGWRRPHRAGKKLTCSFANLRGGNLKTTTSKTPAKTD